MTHHLLTTSLNGAGLLLLAACCAGITWAAGQKDQR